MTPFAGNAQRNATIDYAMNQSSAPAPKMALGSASRRRSQRVRRLMDLPGRSLTRSQACESCYRKKTKCEVEGSGLVCVQCARRGIKCTFSGAENSDDTKRYCHPFLCFGSVANAIPPAMNT